MRIPARLAVVCLGVLLLVSASPIVYAQDASTAGSTAGYVRRDPVDATAVTPFSSGTVLLMPGASGAASTGGGAFNGASTNAATTSGAGGNIFGLDTLPTFFGGFVPGNATGGTTFRFTMMGNDPLVGGTTVIPANIAEVSLQLLNADGSVFKTVPFAPFEDLIEDSPNFSNTFFDSSPNRTQLGDAIQRAEFFNLMKPNWHTKLGGPNVVDRVTITVPRFVNVQLSNGTIIQARSYFTGTAADGSTFVLMLNLLFNFFFDNTVVNEINLGNYTTDSVSMTLFPNTYLFSLNIANPNTPGGCCVLGFHTYFLDPTVNPQPRWVSLYASWISPGIFGGGFQDVTGLSHEISETFNDPFVDNAVPSWQFPGQPTGSKVCQNNLETGDPVEVLPTATVLIPVKEGKSIFAYHPQNEALLQWFEMGPTPSNAVDGAFSYPDTTVLPHSAIPCGH